MRKRFLGLLLCIPVVLSTFTVASAELQSVTDANGNTTIVDKPSDPPPSSGSDGQQPPGGSEKPDEKPDTPSQPEQPDTPNNPSQPNNPGTTNPGTPSTGNTSKPSNTIIYDKNDSSSSSSSSSSSKKSDEDEDEEEEADEKQAETDLTQVKVSYNDVPETEWYYAAVVYVTQQGMMSGNNGNFLPNSPFTRGMMAQILYNLEDKPSYGFSKFPDVPDSEWYAGPAAWASGKGFMSGYSNGNFGPNDPITREQLASILYRYSQEKQYNTSATADISQFSDASSTSDWAEESVRWALGAGLLSGKTGVDGTRLDPAGTATRAEVAQILMNFGQKVAR